ncbi:MAG: hypothetical protein ACREO4_16330 [Lysobacter sp.]
MGKSSSQTIGYHYRVAFHVVLTYPIDAFLEFRGAEKTAWDGSAQTWYTGGKAIRKRGSGIPINYNFEPGAGELTSSGRIQIGAPMLFGGSKDQGGIVGPVDIMFGEADQLPNSYLQGVFGSQVAAWRGFTTLAFCGGQYGAMNPMPQKPSYKVRKILNGWDEPGCWYPERAEISFGSDRRGVPGVTTWNVFETGYFVIGAGPLPTGIWATQQGWWHGHVDCFRIRRGAHYQTKQYAVPSIPFPDASADPNTLMLLRFIGADGSDNFTDERGHDVTPMGGVKLSTLRSKFGGSSAYFDGADDWLRVEMGADEDIGETWTMDAWVWLESYKNDVSTYGRALFGYSDPDVTGATTAWYALSDSWIYQRLDSFVGAPTVIQNAEPYVPAGRWAFVSVCCDKASGLYYMHQDGMLVTAIGQGSMNPAHSLYYVRTGGEKGREPRANINDASLRAAADRLYSEGFGVCWEYDPATDTPDAFEERICRIIGGSFERSLTDGQWYLDLARGDYDVDSLPIIGDDDILEFREMPTTLDRAVNSVAVRYFDVERKEAVITPAVRALGLIRRFGEIHETLDFPQIPNGALALRVADREARAYVTPTRAFELVTTPRVKGLRRNQYFRLQSPKRGIADMVCIVGSKEHGTLKSGAIRLKVSQDIYSLPDTSYIEIEDGVDTTPPTTPVPIEAAKVFEAPYIDLVAVLPRGELDALADDAGFLLAVAADPGVGLSYTMCVQSGGGDYFLAGSGEWCPSTTVSAAWPAEIGPTVVSVTSVTGLADMPAGMLVLWDAEWCRLDALNLETMEATLGRGCADTVPQEHAAGSQLWFYVEAAYDTTEYTDGEQVNVKLLPETGSQQLPLDSATAFPLEFGGRQARPYPPAGLLVNGEESPDLTAGEVTLTWCHRDRILQADQLVDQSAASVGPEPGTTYTARWSLNGSLVHTESGITGTTTSYTPTGGGALHIELESVRDGLASWQVQVREFTIGTALLAEDGSLITDETDQPILME